MYLGNQESSLILIKDELVFYGYYSQIFQFKTVTNNYELLQ